MAIGDHLEPSVLTTVLLVDFGIPDIWAKATSPEQRRIRERRFGLGTVVRFVGARQVEVAETGPEVLPGSLRVPLAADHFRYFAAAGRSEEGRTTEIDRNLVAYCHCHGVQQQSEHSVDCEPRGGLTAALH